MLMAMAMAMMTMIIIQSRWPLCPQITQVATISYKWITNDTAIAPESILVFVFVLFSVFVYFSLTQMTQKLHMN